MGMSNKIWGVAIGAIMIVLAIVVVAEFVESVDTSGWPTIVQTIVGSFLTMVLGVGGLLLILRGLGVAGGGKE